jgi:hypothetical protein
MCRDADPLDAAQQKNTDCFNAVANRTEFCEVTAVTDTNAEFPWLSGCESRHNKSMRIDRS